MLPPSAFAGAVNPDSPALILFQDGGAPTLFGMLHVMWAALYACDKDILRVEVH
jgi:hypothetical protein